MLILRLKQAESAMADGRLDEAFDIVQSDSIRQHRRGQKLIGRLARKLAERGRENLDAERIQLALLDCNKAEKLAGNTTDVAKLRSAICSEMEQKRLRHRHRSFKVAQARQHIEDGWISAGEQILKEAGDKDSQAGIVLQQANVAKLQISEAVAKAEKALQRNDLDGAIEIVLRAGATGNQGDRIVELVAKLKSLTAERIMENFDSGRINIAYSLWQKISPLANGSVEMSELGLVLSQCHQAGEHIAAGRPRAAVPLLGKVRSARPTAKWLNAVTVQTRQAAELLDELAASPLGLDTRENTAMDADNIQGTENEASSASKRSPRPIPNAMKPDTPTGDSLPSKFLLQMDGIGSFIVLRDGRVTVGPVSSSARPMIGLMADPNLPVASIERIQDDYFLRSSSPLRVNDEATSDKLLADGDRIALSPRCRMRFNIPNPASTTATLGLSSARLGRADVRRIILMDRDILVGPSAGDHIVAESLDETMALFVRNGRLLCKTKERILVDEKPVGPRFGLPVDKQIRIGRISLVLTELKE
ncbi:MAG: hypothetical protein U9Q07_02215 [Planctomycetota bacterium]|nr:hypothetical protein [Planctomycetota bacterium]